MNRKIFVPGSAMCKCYNRRFFPPSKRKLLGIHDDLWDRYLNEIGPQGRKEFKSFLIKEYGIQCLEENPFAFEKDCYAEIVDENAYTVFLLRWA